MMGIKVERNIIDLWTKTTKSIRDIWRYRFRNIYIIPDIIFNLTSLGKKQRECINISHSIVEKMIQQRTNELSTMSTNGDIS
ncbi:PREDICTED: cytochrome P450 4C1-like, partial [Cyphomyrmex costatus]|uniref:cytochrome P450 4C1-like n=1 Tax=Cyphomyrmex costatus TaxID=456900 RepID=UPI0008521DEF